MRNRLVVLFAALLILGAAAPAGALAGGSAEATAEPRSATAQPENESTNESAPFGASVSAFVQTSAADAQGEVDDGVFTSRFENASNETRDRLVRERTNRLADRIDRLQDQRSALVNTTGDPSVSERAQAARLAAQIDSLERTLNVTEEAAASAGVNETRLMSLREQTNELKGPELAELARGLAGGPDRERPTRGNGPSADAPSNRTDSGDQGDGPPEDDRSQETDSNAGNGSNQDPEASDEDRGQRGDSADDDRPRDTDSSESGDSGQ